MVWALLPIQWSVGCSGSFEKSYPPREVRPSDCNLSLILRCFPQPPFEPLKLASNKHLTWKMSFLFALVSAKRVSEFHSLSFHVHQSRGWRSCTFSFLSDFIAKTQNPSVTDPHFNEFTVLFLDDVVDGGKDELLLCPIGAL